MQDDTATSHVVGHRERLGRLRLGLQNLSLNSSGWRLISSCKLPHESISAVVVKVDASNISVVQGTCAATFVAIAGTSTVKVGRWSATSTSARKGGSLVLLVLALESLQKIGSGFWGKLIISKSNSNGTTGKIKPVHLLKSFAGLACVSESVLLRISMYKPLKEEINSIYSLDETVATATTCVIFLQLDKLELAKGLKDVLQILLSDAEVDVADVQTMEGN